mgnify:CR=1 FL=1
MFDWILRLFKKKPKKTSYKKSDFTKYRYRKGQREYYCEQTNEWLYWYLLADLVTDDNEEDVNLESFSERKDLAFSNTNYTSQETMESALRYTSTEGYKTAMENWREEVTTRNSGSYYESGSSSGNSYSSSSDDSWGSSSSSSDSGSSSSSSSD